MKRSTFANMEVSVVSASRFLGRCIGCKSEVHEFICSKVKGWVAGVECLAKAKCCYPQSAYTTFTHSLLSECTYSVLSMVVMMNRYRCVT